MNGLTQRTAETSGARHEPRRAGMSVNSSLIAVIGTLLLAMGVGVLIGRSGNGTTAKNPPAQILTVAGPAATSGSAATQPETSATSTTASGATHTAAGAKASTKSTSKKATAPPLKAAKVGSPGHGAGYQNGHFTGNFFGE